jgi:hypothetical protein
MSKHQLFNPYIGMNRLVVGEGRVGQTAYLLLRRGKANCPRAIMIHYRAYEESRWMDTTISWETKYGAHCVPQTIPKHMREGRP